MKKLTESSQLWYQLFITDEMHLNSVLEAVYIWQYSQKYNIGTANR